MSKDNPFMQSASSEQMALIVSISIFWSKVKDLIYSMLTEDPEKELLTLHDEIEETIYSIVNVLNNRDGDIVKIKDFYEILFIMRNNAQPLLIELDKIASNRNTELVLTMLERGKVVTIPISSYIEKYLINY